MEALARTAFAQVHLLQSIVVSLYWEFPQMVTHVLVNSQLNVLYMGLFGCNG